MLIVDGAAVCELCVFMCFMEVEQEQEANKLVKRLIHEVDAKNEHLQHLECKCDNLSSSLNGYVAGKYYIPHLICDRCELDEFIVNYEMETM